MKMAGHYLVYGLLRRRQQPTITLFSPVKPQKVKIKLSTFFKLFFTFVFILVTGTVITEKYYSENGAEPVGERKVTVYSTNPEDLVDLETQYDRRDSETVKREKLSKDGVTTVTKVQKIGKYKVTSKIIVLSTTLL